MSNDITGGLRNLKGGSIDALRGPYPTIAAANLAIPNTDVDGLNFREGKFVEIGVKPNLVTYWWKGGYEDKHLVEYFGELAKTSEVLSTAEFKAIGKNKVDKSKAKAGVYNVNGILDLGSAGVLGAHIENVPGIDFTKEYILTGQRNNSSVTTRAIVRNASGAVVGRVAANGLSEQTLSFSGMESPARLDLNITDNFNVPSGSTPTNNQYSNALMLRLSGTDAIYEAYREGIPNSKLLDTAKQSELVLVDQKATSSKTAVNAMLANFESFYRFGGYAFYKLNKTYLIKNDGDFFEIESRFMGTSYTDGLGLIGLQSNGSSNLFGYYTANSIYLRERKLVPSDPAPPYTIFDALPNLNVFAKIKLTVINGSYQLFIDGVLKSTKPLVNGLEINIIGDAYVTNLVKADLKALVIHKSADGSDAGENLSITDFSSGQNVESVVKLIGSNETTVNPEFFYECNPIGAAGGYPKIMIYAKRKGALNTYVGHEIIRHVDMSEIEYIDYFRNAGAYNYYYNGSIMTRLPTRVLTANESEFTFLQVGKKDHTGGVHGDEIYKSVEFTVDGVNIDFTKSIKLTACKAIQYHVVSDLTETVNSSAPTVPIPGHPIVAGHSKTVVYKNGGYVATNALQSKINPFLPIDKFYTGLICNGKSQAIQGYTEFSNMTDFNFSAGQVDKLVTNFAREFYGFNPETKLSSFITSKCVFPPELDSKRTYYITDRSSDTKYYSEVHDVQLAYGDSVIATVTLECTGE